MAFFFSSSRHLLRLIKQISVLHWQSNAFDMLSSVSCYCPLSQGFVIPYNHALEKAGRAGFSLLGSQI
jgi:hypothetical protein